MSNLDLRTLETITNSSYFKQAERTREENARKDTINEHVPVGFKSKKPLENMTDEELLLMLIASKLDDISSKLDKLIKQ